MEELIEKVEILKDELDKNKSIVNIKKKIMSNELFKKYKEEETNINFIILEINKRLKEINSKGKCHR